MASWSEETRKEFLEEWSEIHSPTKKKFTNKSYQVAKGEPTADMLMWEHMNLKHDVDVDDLTHQIEELKKLLINQSERIDCLEERGDQRSAEILIIKNPHK